MELYVLVNSDGYFVSDYYPKTKATYYTDYILNAWTFDDKERAESVATEIGCTVRRV